MTIPFKRNPDTGGNFFSQLLKSMVLITCLLVLAAVWYWTPLDEVISMTQLSRWAEQLNSTPLLMGAIIAGFIAGGLAFVPITILIGATALIMPVVQSIILAVTGTVLNAWVTYLAGRMAGHKLIQIRSGGRLDRLKTLLGRQGVMTMIIVRNIPVAPFSVINMVAGMSGVRLSSFLIGTAAGMLPGILAITIFTDRIMAMIKNPNKTNIFVTSGVIVTAVIVLWYLKKRIVRYNP